jgi:hypothetical protein
MLSFLSSSWCIGARVEGAPKYAPKFCLKAITQFKAGSFAKIRIRYGGGSHD